VLASSIVAPARERTHGSSRLVRIHSVRERIVYFILFCFGALVGAMLGIRWITRRAALITPPGCAPLLTSPLRLLYRRPAALVRFIGPQPDWNVLDLGCGNGAFARDLARHAGQVCAVDVQVAMVRQLVWRLREFDVTNVCPLVAPAARLPFATGAFDAVLMISVLPMLSDRSAALREVWRVLKPNGLLVVGEELIEPEYVSRPTAAAWVEGAGFTLRQRESNPLCYTMKFVKAQRQAAAGAGAGHTASLRS
jgi:SAM-dependent methyltransferase